ncbi:MAG: TonB-dependent receptor plug domain-containing protein, partial [Epsilonproteobacteria bacterium]|nr:TonB-dependent receptor plug domain-containing protein [Campylobacterota bacterium]
MTKTKLSLLVAFLLSSQLQARNIQLDKVTVTTPTKFSQSLQDITTNVDVITSQEIKERGYQTVSDALKAEPGIVYTRNGGLGKATSIFLRGFEQKRTLVLVDGVRYNDPASVGGAHLQHILMENIERIEIVKGAQSGIWGADASAGVINIITKKASKDGFSATVYAEYGSFNTQTYGVNSAYKQDQFDISLGVQRLTSDGFSAKVPEGADVDDFEDDSYENNTADLKLGYNITENDRVEAFLNYIDAESDFDGYNMDPTLAANDSESTSSIEEKFYGISYTNTEGKNSTKIYFNQSDFSRTSKSGRVSEFDGGVREVGFNSALSYAKNGDLSIGVDCKKFEHDNEISKDYSNQGIFVSNANKFNGLISGTTIFSQSLRYDKFDDFDNKVTYKLGIKHTHDNIKDFWTSINYATAYNVPLLYQLYSPFYGNSNLNPEETKGFDITANYKGFGVTYFHNQIEDLIDYMTTNFTTFAGSYFNIEGKSTLKGVELSYANSIEAANLAYNLNYTYLKTEDKDGEELARRAKNSANLSFDYYGISDTRIGTLIQYVGERKKSQYDANP